MVVAVIISAPAAFLFYSEREAAGEKIYGTNMLMRLEATTRDEVAVEADLRLELRLPCDDRSMESTVKNSATFEQIKVELKAMTEYSFRGTVGRRDLYELNDMRALEEECGNRVFLHSHPPKGVRWKWKVRITNLRAVIGEQKES